LVLFGCALGHIGKTDCLHGATPISSFFEKLATMPIRLDYRNLR
jgi:hypothetical protein